MADESAAIEVVRAYLARVIEAGEAEAVDELVAPAFVNRDPPTGLPGDREGLRAVVAFLYANIAGFRVAVDAIGPAEDGWLVARSDLCGRLTRPLFGKPAGADLRLAIVEEAEAAMKPAAARPEVPRPTQP